MSKNVEKYADEEEWDDVDEEEEEEDTTINNSDVMMMYKRAATWCNEVLQTVVKATVPGAKVVDLCVLGDATIKAKVATAFRGKEKGVAFPTCVSLNNCVAYHSPAPGDETNPQVVKLGDVAHIDLGIHVDGYCALVSHTLQVTETNELAEGTKEANVITAAYTTLNTALRKIRPGATIYEVTEIIEKAAAHFNVQPVEGVLSHMMKRYIIDSFRCIPLKRVPEQLVHDYTFEPGQVWTLDIAFTTGKGKLRERDLRPSLFKTALDSSYAPKMESARELHREIEAKFETFPFAMRSVETPRARLGLSEMLKHNVVVPYPVLYEKDGEVVAHFMVTLLITNKKVERITGVPMQKAPAPAPFTDELLLATSKLSLTLSK